MMKVILKVYSILWGVNLVTHAALLGLITVIIALTKEKTNETKKKKYKRKKKQK